MMGSNDQLKTCAVTVKLRHRIRHRWLSYNSIVSIDTNTCCWRYNKFIGDGIDHAYRFSKKRETLITPYISVFIVIVFF